MGASRGSQFLYRRQHGTSSIATVVYMLARRHFGNIAAGGGGIVEGKKRMDWIFDYFLPLAPLGRCSLLLITYFLNIVLTKQKNLFHLK